MNENVKAFIAHIGSLAAEITIYLARKVELFFLLVKKIIISAKYLDFANIFPKKLPQMLCKQSRANKHIIKLKMCKTLPHKLIYSLELVEFKIFKIYIKINLTNNFINMSKSPSIVLILIIQKSYINLSLCINYQTLNNLTIKNKYLLHFIEESPN